MVTYLSVDGDVISEAEFYELLHKGWWHEVVLEGDKAIVDGVELVADERPKAA